MSEKKSLFQDKKDTYGHAVVLFSQFFRNPVFQRQGWIILCYCSKWKDTWFNVKESAVFHIISYNWLSLLHRLDKMGQRASLKFWVLFSHHPAPAPNLHIGSIKPCCALTIVDSYVYPLVWKMHRQLCTIYAIGFLSHKYTN